MIVGDITRFTNKGMGLAMRVLAAGLAALLALTFLNLTVLPGTAWQKRPTASMRLPSTLFCLHPRSPRRDRTSLCTCI